MSNKKKKSAYAEAGVDIDVMMGALNRAKRMVKSTTTPDVVSDIGSFGGLFRSPGRDHLLVSSVDGVGTKLKVAALAGRHDTVGQCLVNHCVNDILVQGAQPLFFMDYIGAARLDPAAFAGVVKGLTKACRENGCALLGGETAEMPGLYPEGEYDLVGAIVGTVKRSKVITGERIRPGDLLIGLPSSGLHTNGYSLARKVIFDKAGLKVTDPMPGTGKTVGEALLAVHRSYLKPMTRLMEQVPVQGMAHITGGGLIDNIPRVLPEGTGVDIDLNAWKVPPLFCFICNQGGVEQEEMARVFNLGIGMVVMVREKDHTKAMQLLKGYRAITIGRVVKRKRKTVQLTTSKS